MAHFSCTLELHILCREIGVEGNQRESEGGENDEDEDADKVYEGVQTV
jgi:hypothetical protein